MRDIELTDKERLFLANQYEILAALSDVEHYGLMAEALKAGHKWLYDQFFASLSENLPDFKAQHVLTILGIYGDMKASYDHLADKAGIDEKSLTFPGFDGNNEYDLLSFADGLIKHGRFGTTLGKNARNSGMHTTGTYGRMIDRWRELGSPNYPYSKSAIEEILAARIHPDNRK
jgi:uncharacterized protein YfbU (UPF0304 family)